KLAYVVSALQSETARNQPSKLNYRLDERIAEKLVAVFRPEHLGGLVNRKAGRNRALVDAGFHDHSLRFSFAPNSRKKVALEEHVPAQTARDSVLLPPKEALSLFPSLIGSYERREMVMDETYYDLCRKFLASPLKPAQLEPVEDLVRDLETILQGKIILDQGRFLVKTPDKGRLEIGLLAEGLRKIAQLAYLLLNGSLRKGCTLFWDEPDCNLNPKLIRKVAGALVATAGFGIQVVMATHSLFLLRELELLTRGSPLATLYTGLECRNSGVISRQAAEIEDLPSLIALEEELDQSDRYLEMHSEQTGPAI
ncbi:MAG TPA: ATP-binding protein, partial [Desulfonatronum sp.]|nr:ATP-binding protein [Desulfonatronum sp.]